RPRRILEQDSLSRTCAVILSVASPTESRVHRKEMPKERRTLSVTVGQVFHNTHWTVFVQGTNC
ncbi:hypothetical protein CH063_13248, partial [Colletotrichum higginsianum]